MIAMVERAPSAKTLTKSRSPFVVALTIVFAVVAALPYSVFAVGANGAGQPVNPGGAGGVAVVCLIPPPLPAC
jgi:hypothetical protein